ncbi:corrinoid protein [Acetohalobium arabaticum]|uniref:Cobalamin B12-binding domain protein n=1 Tax=Acetohalobium arabaticum (strain ATCC 49924 / DSM 5501 / Z-7288) TaxID=574087 RepID=D9QUA8_ACEAZ|nr:corrinoid protein [Acetohalobium arabaticum]ADL11901.1 cobalamin B12-binding domain protein [Acetohalobium arabaticum DSM 5501]
MSQFDDIAEAVIDGDEERVEELTQNLVDEGEEPSEIIKEGLVAGMDVVGDRFKAEEMFVPQVLIAAEAMAKGMDIVKPLLADDDTSSEGLVLMATVEDDLHDIGKNLASMLLEGSGFNVIDLGTDIPPEEFVEGVKEHEPDIVGMSSLLTTTMPNMESTIEALEEAGIRDEVKIMVGGAPVSQEFADEIGADAYAPDGSTASDLAKEIID